MNTRKQALRIPPSVNIGLLKRSLLTIESKWAGANVVHGIGGFFVASRGSGMGLLWTLRWWGDEQRS